ncbi:Antibiotic efflux pump outer membrane protein ArpC precursor [compost metagenome]
MRLLSKLAPLAILAALQGCSLAPVYHAPSVNLPAHYAEQAPGWRMVKPEDQVPSAWWRLFKDPVLDALQDRLMQANPDLTAAVAHYDAAQAYAQGLHGGLWPQASASASPVRQRQSDNRPLRGGTQPSVYDSNTLNLGVSFDLDLWGKLRNQVAAGDASAQASGDDLAAARLSLQQHLAGLYFDLRGLDAQRRLLEKAVVEREQMVHLTHDRFVGNITSELDLTRAQGQLAEAKAQVDEVIGQRNLAQHAIAELVGEMPDGFVVAESQTLANPPDVPQELPSSLLQRRPDIAAAERRVFAANAGIGIARAAWYPDFSLLGAVGGQTQGAGNLLASANRTWAFGPVLQLPVLDGGRRNADERKAQAEFEEAAARYRSKVLHAVREVEDSLVSVRDLAVEVQDQNTAVVAAENAERMAEDSYREGAVSYLSVLYAQADAIQTAQRLQALQVRQVQASLDLLVATGGGWAG